MTVRDATAMARPFASIDRSLAAMLGLSFSSGLPFLLVYVTQSAWLIDAKVPLATIGLMSELTLAYKFKFVWAPFLDRYDVPVLSRWLGRRRGWIVLSQVGVMLALGGIAFGDPAHWLAWTIVFSLALGFAGATQDVVIDGWRIAVAPDRKAIMSSWAEVGWRVGNLAAGAGTLFLADRYGWRSAYLFMAAAMTPGLVAALLAPEPESDRHRTDQAPAGLIATIWTPIQELMRRLGPLAVRILLLVAGFRMPGYVSFAMAVPLFKSLHYSNTDIATVTKLFGFWVAIAATILGGWIVPRIGMMASLLLGTVAGSASHLALAWLAAHGDHGGGEFWVFAVTVGIDGFAYAFASIVLITYMSTLCSDDLAASQYALLTSLVALPGSLIAGASGFVIERLGFERFFEATSLLGLPVAILCWWVWHVHARAPQATAGSTGQQAIASGTSPQP